MEVRSLYRSGTTKIKQVEEARNAFFNQSAFINRGVWDKYLFDGDMGTGFWPSKRKGDIRFEGLETCILLGWYNNESKSRGAYEIS